MASQILSQAKEKATAMTSAKNQKIADLSAATKDVHDKNWRITSDWGTKQTNTDDWLKVASDDHTGPMLLEDGFGREKVTLPPTSTFAVTRSNFIRSTALTMSEFQSVSYMHAALAPMGNSPYSSRLQTSHLQVCSQIPPVKPPFSFAFQPSLGAVDRQTQYAMFVVSPSNSIPRREIGTSSATTSRCSLSKTP